MSNWEKSIFNKDMYPTPETALDQMQLHLQCAKVFEPSAGAGNIIDYCKKYLADDVMFCEINNDLAEICKTKARFLKHDFLKVTADEVSHITQIVMNPPFSKDVAHILHAWEIAPDGCEITSLCNSESVNNVYSNDRRELRALIENFGNTVDMGDCFSQAERKTNVNVTCVKLFKPVYNSDSTNFEGFYMDSEGQEYGSEDEGVMKFNEIKTLVDNYIRALRCFDEFQAVNEKMMSLCKPVGMGAGFSYEVEYDKQVMDKATFAKYLQKKSWKYIFGKMNLNKYLTSGVMQDINKFVESQTKIPFTVKNVYRMFEIIVGTSAQNFERALVEAVDEFTKYTDENRFHVPGWKTNSGHMLNKKFIVDWIFEVKPSYSSKGAGKLDCRYNSRTDKLNDLTKVLCNITGTDYNTTRSIKKMCDELNGLEPNRWYSNGFFEIKGYKKGTCHLKFADEKVWEQLNRAYAAIKGQVLPESTWGKKEEPYSEHTQSEGQETRVNADMLLLGVSNSELQTQSEGEQIPLFEW